MIFEFVFTIALTTWQDFDSAARDAFKSGDLANAELQWRQALPIAEQNSAVEPGVVTCLTGLAMVNEERSNFSESERLYELGMRTLEQSFGRQSSQFTSYMVNLGMLYQKHGKTQQAEDLFLEFLNSTQQLSGKTSAEMASAYEAYAEYLRRAGRQIEALNAQQAAKNIRSKL